MKVLRISHSGGVTAYRERERQLIANYPVDVRLIVPERWQHLGGEQGKIRDSFEVLTARTYGTGSIPLFAYDPAPIIKQLRDFEPDVVDIHEEPYSVSCFEIVCLVQKFASKAACVFYSAQNIRKNYPPPFCWTERYVYNTCDGAYPCSNGVKHVLAQKGFTKNADVIPLGVDPLLFRPKPVHRGDYKISPSSFVIGYFGRFEECKGVDFVFEALSTMKDNLEWQVVMIGTGDYGNVLKGLAENLGIGDRIIWIGEVKADKVADYINLCDLTVVPSVTTATWKEQFGRAVTESMACGVPVIASDSGSLPEVVGDAGIVVPEKNAQAIAESLRKLIGNRNLLNQMKDASLERVFELYTWKKVADMTFEFYSRALNIKERAFSERI